MSKAEAELLDTMRAIAGRAAQDNTAPRDAAADVLMETGLVPSMQSMLRLVLALEDAALTLHGLHADARDALQTALDATTGAIRAGSHQATIVRGRQGVHIVDETLIPAEYQRTTVSPDKAKIAAALKAKEDVPGAVLKNGSASMRIMVINGEGSP